MAKKHKKPAASSTAPTHPTKEMKLSLVIPCYNEKKRIRPLIDALQDFVKKWAHKYEIIIVDDGSTDGVVEVIQAHPFFIAQKEQGRFNHIIQEQNGGKGKALKAGVLAATGDFILTMDADLSYHPNEVIDWLKMKGGQFDPDEILLGSRLHKKSKNVWEKGGDINDSPFRKFAGFIFNFITQIFTTISVADNQSGFKLYPAPVGKYLFNNLTTYGWTHDVELLYLGDLNHVEVVEMPVTCINREGSKINVFRDSFKMLARTLWIALRIRWKYYIADPVRVTFQNANDGIIPPHLEPQKFKREARFRLLFVLTAAVLLFLMPILSKDYGIAGDEWIQHQYGLEIYDYFFHGGTDAYSQTGRGQNYDAIIYYSGGYEFVAAVLVKLFPDADPYDVRHAFNAFFGFLLMLFVALFAKRIGGWRAGFIALLFIALSPRIFGHSMNNSKDIPFAFAIVFTLYHMVPLLRSLPRPRLKHALLVALGIAIAINIRVGGALLIAYLGLFAILTYLYKIQQGEVKLALNTDFWRSVKYLVAIVVVGYFAGLLFWPYAHQNPLSNPIQALEEMTNFSIHVRILFDGEHIFSDQVPWHYTLTWMLHTSPEIVLTFFGLFVLFSWWIYKHFNNIFIWYILFVTVFPVAYAIYQNSSLYDGWRHFLFVYATLVILAALAMVYFLDISKGKFAKAGIWVVTGIGLLLPASWMVANHPNQYVYFNHASGGLDNAYAQFETDYYMNSIKQTFFKLAEEEDLYNLTDTVYITSNTVKEVDHYADYVSPFIKVGYSHYYNRSQNRWDYGVFMSRYVDQGILENYWPPQGAVATTKVEGVPLSTAVKRVSTKDYEGIQALQSGNTEAAIAAFEEYIQLDTTNERVYSMLGQAYLNQGNMARAVTAYEHAHRIHPNDDNILINLSIAYLSSGQGQKALHMLGEKVRKNEVIAEKYRAQWEEDPENQQAYGGYMQTAQLLGQYYFYFGIAQAQSGNLAQAETSLNNAVQYNPELKRQAYGELARLYQAQGDMQRAQQYMQMANQ